MTHPGPSDPPWRRTLAVLGPPCLLLALGAWQVERGRAGATSLAREAAGLSVLADRMDAVAAVTPDRTVRFVGDPEPHGAREAATMLHDGVALLRRDVLIDRVRVGVALATLGGGAAGLLAGVAGLLAAAWAARRSRRSREALVAAFSRVRALLPVLLGALVGGLALACSAAVAFEVAGWLPATTEPGLGARLLTPGLAVAGTLAWLGWITLRELRRSLAAFVPSPLPLLGRAVTPEDAPGLWRFVAARAVGQGAAMPDHVVVGLEDGFFATAADVALAPGGELLRGRTLHVPLPMLAMLDADEVAAIVGHELAHFGGDTGYGLRVLPIHAGIARNLQALRSVRGGSGAWWTRGPAITLGTHMMAVFDGAVGHWSRLGEIEADRAGVREGGAAAAARALVRTALLQPLIDAAMAEGWQDFGAAAADLVAAAIAHARAVGLGDPAAALEQRQPHPTDSHPPSGQRLEALGVGVTEALLTRAARPVPAGTTAFAETLFRDWAGTCAAVSEDALGLAASGHAEHTLRLREAAGQPTEAVVEVLGDWRRPAAIWCVAGCVLLGTGLVFLRAVLLPSAADAARDAASWLAAAGLPAAGAAALLRTAMLWRSRATPLITLQAEGFLCRGLDRMVPWIGVERLSLTRQRSTHVFIHLKDTTRLPRRMVGWGVLVHGRRRVVTMLGVRPRDLTPDGFVELLHRYWSAAVARAALAGEEPAYSMILSEEEMRTLLDGDA